jgi:hypothetical protein
MQGFVSLQIILRDRRILRQAKLPPLCCALENVLKTGNSYWKGRLSTVDLLFKIYFSVWKTPGLNYMVQGQWNSMLWKYKQLLGYHNLFLLSDIWGLKFIVYSTSVFLDICGSLRKMFFLHRCLLCSVLLY